MTHCRFLVGLTVSLVGLVAPTAHAVQSEAETPSAKATPTAAEHPLAMPPVRFSLPPDYDNENAYARSFAEEAATLATRAEATSETTARADLMLAAANVILARELEAPCTRALLGLPAVNAESRKAVIAALDRADGLLSRAGVLIESERMRTGLPGGWGETAARRFNTLQSFAAAMRGVFSGSDAADGAKPRRSWSKLSALLEDSDRRVAAAAALWQAHLRSRDKDGDRALLVLEPALADPHKGTMPYAFFARLTRCRVVADRGGHAAALALLMQIEERYADWFTDRKRQPEALRAIRVVEMTVLQAWYDRLGDAEHEQDRLWCGERLKELQESDFDADPDHAADNAVLRLSPAIPIVATPPTPQVQPLTPATDGQ